MPPYIVIMLAETLEDMPNFHLLMYLNHWYKRTIFKVDIYHFYCDTGRRDRWDDISDCPAEDRAACAELVGFIRENGYDTWDLVT